MNNPNIILLTIDTLRADRLGCYGYKPTITPNMDRIAENGIRCTQAITGGSWTQAAFPVILTSTYASMYGGCLGSLAPERPSPIRALGEHGYSTAGFSTSPLLSRGYGYEINFDHFTDLVPRERDPWLRKVKGGHTLLKQPFTHYLSRLMRIRTRPAKIYSSAIELTDHICQWIGKAQKPFFVWAHYMDVHWPYHLEESLKQPSQIAQAWKDVVHLHNANWNGAEITPEEREHYLDLYEKAVAYTDTQVGRLLDFLEGKGLDKNTILILVSDHGEEFLEHGRWGHWEDNLYDEILKVPLLIQIPGISGNTLYHGQVRTIDLMPTMLNLTDSPIPQGMKGTNLVPVLKGDVEQAQPAIAISEMWRDDWHIIAVRTEKYKYIWDNKRPNQPRLFDLDSDPGEQQNLAPAEINTVKKLHSYVDEVLNEMARTRLDQIDVPDMDEEMLNRLRDLGYVQ